MASPSDEQMKTSWFIYGHSDPKERLDEMLQRHPPSWRDFSNEARRSAYEFQIGPEAQAVVNAAIYLRRPLLVTGDPGTGKSSLAYSIASKLELDPVLEWPITSRSTLKEALYQYDAIGRLQAANLGSRRQGDRRPAGPPDSAEEQLTREMAPPIEDFLKLGPLGTALADSKEKPRVLLIDEIDKSDIDLPNDLLFLFEEGKFEIPELARLARRASGTDSGSAAREMPLWIRKHDWQSAAEGKESVPIAEGMVSCTHFPIVIMTSNGERDMPAPFLRRCLRLEMASPDKKMLEKIVAAHFDGIPVPGEVQKFIEHILSRREKQNELIATDQLMNAVYMAQQIVMDNRGETKGTTLTKGEREMIEKIVLNAIRRTR